MERQLNKRGDTNPVSRSAHHSEHRIDIAQAGRRIRAVAGNRVLADSRDCLLMREAGYPPIHYFPRADVRMDLLTRTSHHSHCPYKGDASYWSAGRMANVAWSYESPFDALRVITGYVAFYPDRVAIEQV